MAQVFVKENLKSPATAEFPNAWNFSSGSNGCLALFNAGVWTLTSYVDSQNSFGALIRTHYVVQLTYTADDEMWHLQDLVFLD
jgi:hypothetical protein